MPRISIDDVDDPRIESYRHLKATNRTRWLDRFVVEGLKLVLQLRDSRYPLDSVLVSDRHVDRVAPDVPPEVPLYVVPHDQISTLVGYKFHQGALACGVRLPQENLNTIIGRTGPRLTMVVCPIVQNPENLGTIVRTADVFGVDAVLVGPSCPDPLSRRVLRVSMGTVLRQPVLILEDLADRLEHLRREHDVRFFATVTDPDADPIDEVGRPDRLAIVMGSEAHGLDPDWIARCDRLVTIPMRAGAESLNVSVATGIVLDHLARPKKSGRNK